MNPVDDHLRNPRNAGMLAGADLHVEVENPVCGDILHLYLKLEEGGEMRVEDARFQVYGCPAAIASGSLLTEKLRGRSRDEVESISVEEIDRELGGLGREKIHAAVLARDALAMALERWRGRC